VRHMNFLPTGILSRSLICSLFLVFGATFTMEVQAKMLPQGKTLFSEKELEPYKRTGKAAISGQAFLKTQGGDVKLGAGCKVTLSPATQYMKKYYANIALLDQALRLMREVNDPRAYWPEAKAKFEKAKELKLLAGDDAGELDSRQIPYQKQSIADAGGNFEFKGLPPGEYIINCRIEWQVGGVMQGGTIIQTVTIGANESKKIILTE